MKKNDYLTFLDITQMPLGVSLMVKFPNCAHAYDWKLHKVHDNGITIESTGIMKNHDFIPMDRIGATESTYQFTKMPEGQS